MIPKAALVIEIIEIRGQVRDAALTSSSSSRLDAASQRDLLSPLQRNSTQDSEKITKGSSPPTVAKSSCSLKSQSQLSQLSSCAFSSLSSSLHLGQPDPEESRRPGREQSSCTRSDGDDGMQDGGGNSEQDQWPIREEAAWVAVNDHSASIRGSIAMLVQRFDDLFVFPLRNRTGYSKASGRLQAGNSCFFLTLRKISLTQAKRGSTKARQSCC